DDTHRHTPTAMALTHQGRSSCCYCFVPVLFLPCPTPIITSVSRGVNYLGPYMKSSNSVTLSAFVQTPTFPASLNVSSSHSTAFWPWNVTAKCPAWNSTRSVCHWFVATGIRARFFSERRPLMV